VNKAELIAAVADDLSTTKVAAERAVESVLSVISAELSVGGEVRLIGFGSFTVKERAAREGRNPQTGAKLTIAAKRAVAFKPGKTLNDAV
jgi:DNA-binding protein HU-beta